MFCFDEQAGIGGFPTVGEKGNYGIWGISARNKKVLLSFFTEKQE